MKHINKAGVQTTLSERPLILDTGMMNALPLGSHEQLGISGFLEAIHFHDFFIPVLGNRKDSS